MVLIPAMVAFGIPPINAITINKFQNSVGAFAAIHAYGTKGFTNFADIKRLLPAAVAGAVLGAIGLGTLAKAGIFNAPCYVTALWRWRSIPSCLTGSFVVVGGVPPIECVGDVGCMGVVRALWGSVSLGTGPVLIAAHRLVHNSELNSAITMTKLIMLAINMTSMSVLILMGHLWWQIALLLAVGNVFGAMAGARMVTWSLDWLARIIVFVVPVILAFKLMGWLSFLDA